MRREGAAIKMSDGRMPSVLSRSSSPAMRFSKMDNPQGIPFRSKQWTCSSPGRDGFAARKAAWAQCILGRVKRCSQTLSRKKIRNGADDRGWLGRFQGVGRLARMRAGIKSENLGVSARGARRGQFDASASAYGHKHSHQHRCRYPCGNSPTQPQPEARVASHPRCHSRVGHRPQLSLRVDFCGKNRLEMPPQTRGDPGYSHHQLR